MSATSPGKYPLTEAEKAERMRKARELAAQMDQVDPQVRSDSAYDILAEAGRRLTGAGEDPDEAELDLLNTWTPTDLKVGAAIASGRLTRRGWDEMDPAEREKLFRPRGFKAWERGRTS